MFWLGLMFEPRLDSSILSGVCAEGPAKAGGFGCREGGNQRGKPPVVVRFICSRSETESIGIEQKTVLSVDGIFTYIWAICWVNVGKYTIHGLSGKRT